MAVHVRFQSLYLREPNLQWLFMCAFSPCIYVNQTWNGCSCAPSVLVFKLSMIYVYIYSSKYININSFSLGLDSSCRHKRRSEAVDRRRVKARCLYITQRTTRNPLTQYDGATEEEGNSDWKDRYGFQQRNS